MILAELEYVNEAIPGVMHGYTMSDTAAYNPAARERAFKTARGLFDTVLG